MSYAEPVLSLPKGLSRAVNPPSMGFASLYLAYDECSLECRMGAGRAAYAAESADRSHRQPRAGGGKAVAVNSDSIGFKEAGGL
ncbi:hypothetical protein sS8_0343 [Methylocaldum marinum]|uniref:Uncharacterized protein n=1 Tax=Methylocaldum marinum TaxID=1432792 RepID=A0A286P3T9_9GAMM|nr:hypothetical protein sS8_0343 [Methylocaldum marinum]